MIIESVPSAGFAVVTQGEQAVLIATAYITDDTGDRLAVEGKAIPMKRYHFGPFPPEVALALSRELNPVLRAR